MRIGPPSHRGPVLTYALFTPTILAVTRRGPDGRRPPDRDELPAPPPVQLGRPWSRLATSPGARKEALKKREYARPAGRRGGGGPRYAELRAASAFSFLDGASPPEDLVAAAAAAGLPAMAIADRNGVYGAPRFHQAAKEAGLRALVGAEVTLDRAGDDLRLTLLVEDRAGYRNLCRLLTSAAFGPAAAAPDQVLARRAKGGTRAWWPLVEEHARWGIQILDSTNTDE